MALLEALRVRVSMWDGGVLTPASLIYLVIALVIVAFPIQRLYFHPLAKFPGPWLNKLSVLPVVLRMARGRQHEYYMKLHRRYGPVVRVSPNELIFCGANAWEDIHGNKPGKPDMEKAPYHAGGLPQNMPAYWMTIAPWDVHVRQRKAWAHPFSNTALLSQEPLIQRYVDKLMDRLSKLATNSAPSSSTNSTDKSTHRHVNISAWMTYTTFDIIGELCFAEPFGCLDRGEFTEWSTAVGKIGVAAAWEQISRRVGGVNTFFQKGLSNILMPGDISHWRIVHFSNCRERTLRRIRIVRGDLNNDEDRQMGEGDREGGGGGGGGGDGKGKEHRGFIYYLAGGGAGGGDGKGGNALEKGLLSELEVIMNVALIVGAGSDTTALFLSMWTNLMLKNQTTSYQQLVTEIRTAFNSPSDIKFTTVKNLPYLNAVINETFRLCPPVPTNFCRVVPHGGALIDRIFIPPGTAVSVSPWAATHSTLNWEEPYLFKPERWLDTTSNNGRPRDKKHASQPFSHGPRGCIGRNLAQIEQKLIICHLLLRFDIEPPEKGSPEEEDNEKKWTLDGDMEGMKAMFIWEKPPLWVRLREVKV